jgi:hypothetical protein
MSTRLVAVSLAGLLAAASCGTASSEAGHPGSPLVAPAGQTTLTSSTATVAHNRAATRAEAARLLALTPLPAGATTIKKQPADLDGPAMGVPETPSLIDLHRYWIVDQPMAVVAAYVKAHPPTHLTYAGGGSGTTHGVLTSEGFAWSEPNRKYAEELQDEVSLAPANNGQSTYLRGDGVGEWLDPRPVRDPSAGPRFHVDLAAGCPGKDNVQEDVRNEGGDLNQRLLPSAKPTAALICEYDGGNRKPHFGLGRSAQLDAADAARLASRFGRLQVPHTDGGSSSCPMDDGTGNLVIFAYRGRPDVDLLAAANGCQSVRNGDIEVSGGISYRPWVSPLPI